MSPKSPIVEVAKEVGIIGIEELVTIAVEPHLEPMIVVLAQEAPRNGRKFVSLEMPLRNDDHHNTWVAGWITIATEAVGENLDQLRLCRILGPHRAVRGAGAEHQAGDGNEDRGSLACDSVSHDLPYGGTPGHLTSSISGRARRRQGQRNDLAARAPLHALVRPRLRCMRSISA